MNYCKCEECRIEFNPWDDEFNTQATMLSIPASLGTWGNALFFCSASCLHKFSNPDRP